MVFDLCEYPPRLAADLEMTEQRDGDRASWVVGSEVVNRYVILRETEVKVLRLLEEGLTTAGVCEEFKRLHGGTLTLNTLTRFLTKLEQVGILAGVRNEGYGDGRQVMRQPYLRLRLFNPDSLFGWMLPGLRWIWTPGFVATTIFLMLTALLLSALNWAEVSTYGQYVIREHYLVVFCAAWVVVATHEFAHGLTCKMFGGRATEMGVLGVYYFVPALYCNVSGLHRIEKRGRRLWVIAAGVYWQLLVGTMSLLIWFLVQPYTLLSDLALAFCLGSLLNIVFNANPLIKLDGYYFLSQLLRLPNLMDRSRAFWRSLWKKAAYGEVSAESSRYSLREKWIYALFGVFSVGYTAVFSWFIISYVGGYLISEYQLIGVFLSMAVVGLLLRRPLRSLVTWSVNWSGTFMVNQQNVAQLGMLKPAPTGHPGGSLAPVGRHTIIEPIPAAQETEAGVKARQVTLSQWRRRLVPLVMIAAVVGILVFPWEASVGSYGTVVPQKQNESVITAPEAGMITVLVKPGEQVESGRELARLRNPDLSSDLIALRADIMRIQTEYEQLTGDLKTRSQAVERAEVQLGESSRLEREYRSEQQQLLSRRPGDAGPYPAAMAMLQADIELRKSRLAEAETRLGRTRQLFHDNLIPKSELESVEANVTALKLEVEAANEKLQNALVEHRRSTEKQSGDVRVNQTELQSAKGLLANTTVQIQNTGRLLDTLRQREQVLLAKQTSVVLTATRAGTVLGENLLELNGKYLEKGGEVCRVADTRQMLIRIQIPEREIGDIHPGAAVRIKASGIPDRVFNGRVEKIGTEAEFDQNHQLTYRVELVIDNTDGALKPGMTAFTRIGFGEKTVGWILLHKIKQALRPELWLF